jgi:hypothetical protein
LTLNVFHAVTSVATLINIVPTQDLRDALTIVGPHTVDFVSMRFLQPHDIGLRFTNGLSVNGFLDARNSSISVRGMVTRLPSWDSCSRTLALGSSTSGFNHRMSMVSSFQVSLFNPFQAKRLAC